MHMEQAIDTDDDVIRHNAGGGLPKAGTVGSPVRRNAIVATVAARSTDAGTESALATFDAGKPLQNPRYELFAVRVAAGSSYKDAYSEAFPNPTTSARHNASRLARDISVRARIQALTRAAAASTQHLIVERLQQLADIASADPSELARVVISPCKFCWPTGPTGDMVLAAALDDAAAANAPMPDTNQPRGSCDLCGGHGVQRVELTPTDELSGQARRLMKSCRQKADGSVEVTTHDALAAMRLHAELSGWLVTQNANLNINANAPLATPAPVSADDVLSAFHALRKVSNP